MIDTSSMTDAELWQLLSPYTMVSWPRFLNVQALCHEIQADRLTGDFVECGVWRGGVVALMAALAKHENAARRVVAFDSFAGLPKPTAADGARAAANTSQCIASRVDFDRLMEAVGYPNVLTFEGWFKDTLPKYEGQIALLRLDGDWYDSTMQCLQALYDKVVVGGYIIVDDYGYWPGCRNAVDAFRGTRGIAAPMHRIDNTGTWWRKEN